MRKIQIKSEQTAQGMLEFALVLPILLLLILGVFAFGHMFFVYSSVVSASREAARWGAAVGEASGGASPLPRYQDCATIRAAAVRVGAFAGVNNTDLDIASTTDTGVNIVYDHGPNSDPDTIPVDFSCPEGDFGPAQVMVGDRIVVTVRVLYRPIVPFVNLPSFPLEATTARTIIINVPVGEAPIAEDPCAVDTLTEIIPTPADGSVVGQPMSYMVRVSVPDDPDDIPIGTVSLLDTDGNNWGGPMILEDGIATFPMPEGYAHVGDKQVTVVYSPDNTCYTFIPPDSPLVYPVDQAPTEMLITLPQATSIVANQAMQVTVAVRAVAPGAGEPTGPVTIYIPGLVPCTQNLEDGTPGEISCTFIPLTEGVNNMVVTYAEDASLDFAGVVLPQDIFVYDRVTEIPTDVVPTLPPGAPTRTPQPPYCPRAVTNMDFSEPGALQFNIANNHPDSRNIDIASINIIWPSSPEARFQQVRLGTNVDVCNTSPSSGERNCLWNNASGLLPTNQTVSSSTTGWLSQAATIERNSSKTIRLGFNGTLPPGDFRVTIRFNDAACTLEVEGSR